MGGLLQLDVIVRGVSSHASQPWYGTNAFEDGIKVAYALIKELKPKVESRQIMGERATITLGGLARGGVSRNLVPDYFQFSIDRRILPSESIEHALNEIMSGIDNLRNNIKSTVEVHIVNKIEPAISKESTLLTKLMNAVKNVLGMNPKVTISRVPVDTRYLQNMGIDSLTYGPGNVSSAHGPDEYINVSDIVNAVNVYTELIRNIYDK